MAMVISTSSNSSSGTSTNEGVNCHGDDREALSDFAKYFNNAHLSDLTLVVGEELFPAHRLILCRSSEVFDRMLSQNWNGNMKKEVELTEEPQCQAVFGQFLRFLYCNHVVLNSENVLSILILADKYNVNGLKKICVNFAIECVLPQLQLKELFHFWFNYSTKAYHPPLIKVCIDILAKHFNGLLTNSEWEKEWLDLDRDQLLELLKSNVLVVPNEYLLWESVLKWLLAPGHPERKGNMAAPLLVKILPFIRFPYMTAVQLCEIESVEEPMELKEAMQEIKESIENGATEKELSMEMKELREKVKFLKLHEKLLKPHIHAALKFISLPLISREKFIKEMNSSNFSHQFMLRDYTEPQWEKRICVTVEELKNRNGNGYTLEITTKSSSVPSSKWKWRFDLQSQNLSNYSDEFKAVLTAVDLDHNTVRSVEYMLMVCGEKRIMRKVAGAKTFTKSRYSADLELRGILRPSEIFYEDSHLLHDGNLELQLLLRPIL